MRRRGSAAGDQIAVGAARRGAGGNGDGWAGATTLWAIRDSLRSSLAWCGVVRTRRAIEAEQTEVPTRRGDAWCTLSHLTHTRQAVAV